eukprot:scaffold1394_cov109-Isochrysis_galbana.AAC.28
MPRLRIARDSSPALGTTARNRRKSGCGSTCRSWPPDWSPASGSCNTPPRSNRGLSRSSTDGLHRLALSSSNQWPSSIARSSGPSTHTKRPLEPESRSSDRQATRARTPATQRRASLVKPPAASAAASSTASSAAARSSNRSSSSSDGAGPATARGSRQLERLGRRAASRRSGRPNDGERARQAGDERGRLVQHGKLQARGFALLEAAKQLGGVGGGGEHHLFHPPPGEPGEQAQRAALARARLAADGTHPAHAHSQGQRLQWPQLQREQLERGRTGQLRSRASAAAAAAGARWGRWRYPWPRRRHGAPPADPPRCESAVAPARPERPTGASGAPPVRPTTARSSGTRRAG